ncbi:MAG: hypothetical protein CMIDDMOC_00932 [Sodalis sp. Fle]|nr:MAG: hypothetical protein CMIDDMOC_00932 [Sodalis sp. Fle]
MLLGNSSVLYSALENIVRNALLYLYHQILIVFSADPYSFADGFAIRKGALS